eukprot:613053_1
MSVSRVLINGGGIAGLSTALSLARVGISSKIFEARLADDKPHGGGLLVFPKTQEILHNHGLGEELAKIANPLNILEIQDNHGLRLHEMQIDTLTLPSEHGLAFVRHSDLHNLLKSAVEKCDGVEIDYGRTIQEIKQDDPGNVQVTTGPAYKKVDNAPKPRQLRYFEKQAGDTAEESGALLVGADGADSAVRGLLFGDCPSQYTGITLIGGEISNTHLGVCYQEPDLLAIRFGNGKMFWHAQTHDGRAQWWFAARCPKPAPPGEYRLPRVEEAKLEHWESQEQETDVLQDLYEIGICFKMAPPLPYVCWATEEYVRHDIYARAHLTDAWHSGRCIVIGDAAHPSVPMKFDGPNLALEEGDALATKLSKLAGGVSSDKADLEAMFQDFYNERQLRTSAVPIRWDRVFTVNPLWKQLHAWAFWARGNAVMKSLTKPLFGQIIWGVLAKNLQSQPLNGQRISLSAKHAIIPKKNTQI